MTGPVTIRPRSAPRPTIGDDPDPAPTAFEQRVLDAFNHGRRTLGRPAARYDVVLGDVARGHARIIIERGEAASEAAVDHLLGWAGATDPHPQRHILITMGGEELELLAHVERLAGDEAHEIAELVIGVGTHKAHGRTVMVTVVSDRAFHLDRSQRRVKPGVPIELSGRLSPGFSRPELLFLVDGEQIRHVLPSDGELGLQGGRVTFRFAPPTRGQVLAEILLVGPLGPTVGALFPLSVGEDPPGAFTLEPPPDESEIRSAADAEDRLLQLINRERADRHLPALIRSDAADEAARDFAVGSLRSGVMAHVGGDGSTVRDRVAARGVAAARVSENLARNSTVEEVHLSLMRSLGHRQNILDRDVDYVGIGVATKPPIIDGIDKREFWVVCNFFRSVPIVAPGRDSRTLREAFNVLRADAQLAPLRMDSDLDMLAAKLASRVLRSRTVEPEGMEPMVRKAMELSASRWSTWALQVYRVALPLDEATDATGALKESYTHVGIGLAQPSLDTATDDPRTAVVFVFAEER
jgi:uncharacterized protein YkwD